MVRTVILGKMLALKQGGAAAFYRHDARWMATKASNRAAVHGSKLPVPSIIPEEEVEMEANRATKEKDKQRRKMEDTVDSHLKNWQVLYVEEIVSSK